VARRRRPWSTNHLEQAPNIVIIRGNSAILSLKNRRAVASTSPRARSGGKSK
jgi:hypothetical protein